MTTPSMIPNPDGYHRAAASLRRRAEDLSYYAQRVDRTVTGTTFEGRGAERFRQAMAEERATVLRICGELHTYANSMSRAARVYEAQIASLQT